MIITEHSAGKFGLSKEISSIRSYTGLGADTWAHLGCDYCRTPLSIKGCRMTESGLYFHEICWEKIKTEFKTYEEEI
jgi:hypothetical protein